MKKKILVRAPVLSQSGYGEQSRFALRALKSREDLFEIFILPISWGKTGWIWEESEFRRWIDEKITLTQVLIQRKELQVDISLQITIPNEFEKIAPINVGYTAGIESNQCSPQWLPKCNDMDKVLVVSNHAKNSIVNTVAQICLEIKNNKRKAYFIPNLGIELDLGFALDYVEAMWLTLQQPKPDDYIIASGKTCSIEYICDHLFSRLGMDYKDHIKTSSNTPNFIAKGDCTKLKSLGWSPKFSLNEILDKILYSYEK